MNTTTTAIVAELIATVTPRRASFRSPDQQWEALFLTYDCTQIVAGEWYESAFERFQMVNLPDGEPITIAEQLQYCGGLGAFGLAGITWAPNSQYFYFTTAANGVPDGMSPGWHRPISRYDTRSGETEYIHGQFSPDGQAVAGVLYQKEKWCLPEALVVQTLNGDVLARYPTTSEQQDCYPGYGMNAKDYQWMANVAWSGDSRSVAYLEIACVSAACKSTLYVVDLDNQERQVLLPDHQPAFLAVDWSRDGRLTLVDEAYQTWIYTRATGQLEQQGP